MTSLSRTTAVNLVVILSFLFLNFAPQAAAADKLVKGDLQRARVNKLTGNIYWHKSLAQAQADARSKGKMIFWVNILGKLDGST